MYKLFYFVSVVSLLSMEGFAADAKLNRKDITKKIAEIIVSYVQDTQKILLTSASQSLSSDFPTIPVNRLCTKITNPLFKNAKKKIALSLKKSKVISEDMLKSLCEQIESELYARYHYAVQDELAKLNRPQATPAALVSLSESQQALNNQLNSLPGATATSRPMNERLARRFFDEDAQKIGEIISSAAYHEAIIAFNRSMGR